MTNNQRILIRNPILVVAVLGISVFGLSILFTHPRIDVYHALIITGVLIFLVWYGVVLYKVRTREINTIIADAIRNRPSTISFRNRIDGNFIEGVLIFVDLEYICELSFNDLSNDLGPLGDLYRAAREGRERL